MRRLPRGQLSGGATEAASPTPDARTAGLIHALAVPSFVVSLRTALRQEPSSATCKVWTPRTRRCAIFASALNGIEIHIERGGLVVPKLSDAHLPDVRGEMQSLALDLQRAGIQSLAIARQFHVGELDTLAQLFKASLLRSEESIKRGGSSWWAARFLENRVEGISINTQTERKVDTVLASLMGALVAYGGNSPREVNRGSYSSAGDRRSCGRAALDRPIDTAARSRTRAVAGRSGAGDSRSDGRCEPGDGPHAAQFDFAVCPARGRAAAAILVASFGELDS